MAAIPLSTVIGAPVSGLLLSCNGIAGPEGLAVAVHHRGAAGRDPLGRRVLLPDRPPSDATWLAPEERTWLADRLDAGAPPARGGAPLHRPQALIEPEGAGAEPRLLRRRRHQLRPQLLPAADRQGVRRCRTCRPAWSTAIPYVVGTDRHGAVGPPLRPPSWSAGGTPPFPLFVAAAGIAVSTALDDPDAEDGGLRVAGFGIFGCLPVFWTLPTAFLSGAAAAAASPSSTRSATSPASPAPTSWAGSRTRPAPSRPAS